ncbi:hypothetical protein EPO34_00760 [Patescibacteria group bacterium]|nr:MAG: hypothetical protein EPO34_00760 [Patescibacteria group bacterium]
MYKPHHGKHGGGFGGGKKFGGSPSWKRGGADERGFVRPDLHDATCGKCGAPCKVPFRPNGSRPIYCRDCFKKDDASEPKRFEKRPFGDKPYRSTPHASGGNIEARLKAIEDKLDAIIEALEDDM